MSYKDDYFTDLITNRSISFIRRTKQTKPDSPFLAVVSHSAPHGPETAAPQYSNAFPNARAPRYVVTSIPSRSFTVNTSGESLKESHHSAQLLLCTSPETIIWTHTLNQIATKVTWFCSLFCLQRRAFAYHWLKARGQWERDKYL